MKVLKVAGVSLLALSLVLGLALPALAAPDGAPPEASHMPPKVLMGEVVDKGESSFVIQSRGQELTISVNDDTQYLKAPIPRVVLPLARRLMGLRQQSQERSGLRRWLRPFAGRAGLFFEVPAPWKVPALARHRVELRQGWERLGLVRWLHPFAKEATFDDIAVGTHVVVCAAPAEDSPVAKLVIIIKPIGYGCILGAITNISPEVKTITIAPADGGTDIVLSYNEGTRFILRGITELGEGQSIRAVYDEEMIAKVVFVLIEVP